MAAWLQEAHPGVALAHSTTLCSQHLGCVHGAPPLQPQVGQCGPHQCRRLVQKRAVLGVLDLLETGRGDSALRKAAEQRARQHSSRLWLIRPLWLAGGCSLLLALEPGVE